VFSSNVKLKNCCYVAEFSQTILHKGILWWTGRLQMKYFLVTPD
jgi:hypothetical protein